MGVIPASAACEELHWLYLQFLWPSRFAHVLGMLLWREHLGVGI